MKSFRQHTGLVAPLNRTNVDTDQIIPKQFLTRIERSGFGQFLFFDWAHQTDGSKNESFILNQPEYANASILVAGKNFGCGSSREHAPWALADWGFRAIIAPSFADIFANNCTKNGLLTICLPDDEVELLLRRAQEVKEYKLTVDLEQQVVSDEHGFKTLFEFDVFQRQCLLEGLDDIGLTMKHEQKILRFEEARPRWCSFS